jgi:hypothetical protein
VVKILCSFLCALSVSAVSNLLYCKKSMHFYNGMNW